jgi:hypothetical protein
MLDGMVQHPPPSIKGFFRVIWHDWGARMTGIFTLPFTACAIYFSGFGRALFGAMAILAFFVTAYRVWADERWKLSALEQHLALRLRFEFDPKEASVLARALSPTVNNCRAYLVRVSQWDGLQYITLWDESLPLPWSYSAPIVVEPRQLNHEIDEFLDVAWFVDPNLPALQFGFLNAGSIIPNRLRNILADQILPFPARNLKLDLVITGEDSENATISLNIHRGHERARWTEPQIRLDGRAGNSQR